MFARRPEWLLFDDEGIAWPASSLELRRRLACLDYEGDLAGDLVRNLGFVAVLAGGRRFTLRVHVQVVSPVALAAAFYWLFDQPPGSVLIDFVGEDRLAEVHPTTGAAIKRLARLTRWNELGKKVAEKLCDLDQLSPRSPLYGLLQLWRQHEGRFDASSYIGYAAEHLASRFIVIRQCDFDRLLFHILGEGLHVPDPNWLKTAVGRPVEDQPDGEYWSWVAQTYRETLRSNRPGLSDIDADIFWPSKGWVRRRYRRLRLPCTAADGTRYLFSANSAESGVALRSQVA
jgi:hypothetical protein